MTMHESGNTKSSALDEQSATWCTVAVCATVALDTCLSQSALVDVFSKCCSFYSSVWHTCLSQSALVKALASLTAVQGCTSPQNPATLPQPVWGALIQLA